ncbi:MAG TPA: aldehyde dehydrogenase (NADP(+)) [Acidobacteriaceae bacterium]|nr:aldehyde dehydrogenase (NADP(+)) [Acidobacteriaceae bacterium]
MELHGISLIGFGEGGKGKAFQAMNPATGLPLETQYYSATTADVERAGALAREAFPIYSQRAGKERGAFLRQIAAALEASAAEIIKRAQLETALPEPRLQGELARTCNQLRLYAQTIEEGSWVGARLDSGDPARKPVPKPVLRSMFKALGPVAVFGASNFPLAYSVAGGDTASALAAGNPVIVKAHPAHPGTSEIVGRLLCESVRAAKLPEGVFSLLFDANIEIGAALVQHPAVKAVGFTGSRAGGTALMKLAAARPEPIPCYAEMGSVNPIFVLPGVLKKRAEAVAAGLQSSFTLGGGQFCTKPGIVMVPAEDGVDKFLGELGNRVSAGGPHTLLTRGIASHYATALEQRVSEKGATVVARGQAPDHGAGATAQAALFLAEAKDFLSDPDLSQEVFGPTSLLVRYGSKEEMLAVAEGLEGHLTATIHAEESDLEEYAGLIEILSRKAGRLIFNAYPTGVEVGHAIVHGGPFPATSDGRSTSVGSLAIFRFARLVCYQDFPEPALPDELKAENPLGIWRMIDGEMTRDAIR